MSQWQWLQSLRADAAGSERQSVIERQGMSKARQTLGVHACGGEGTMFAFSGFAEAQPAYVQAFLKLLIWT